MAFNWNEYDNVDQNPQKFNWNNYDNAELNNLSNTNNIVQSPQQFDWSAYEDSTLPKVLSGGVEKKYTQNWDKNGNIYLTDEYGNKVKNSETTPLQKFKRKIKTFANNTNNWINETNPESESYKEKANMTLAAITTPLGLSKTATQFGISKISPLLGKKIARATIKGAGSGLVSGGTFGFGRGLIEGKNPLKTMVNDASLGFLTGGGLGIVAGKLGQSIATKNSKNILTKNKISKKLVNQNLNSDIVSDIQTNIKPLKEIKHSKLVKNAELPTELSQAIKINPPEYQVLHNKDLIAQAEHELNNIGLNDVAETLRNQENFSALDFEKARQTIQKLYQEGRINEAITLTEQVAEKGSKAGQAVQAMSLWAKTTPEGAITFAQKILDKYNKSTNKNLKLSNEQAENIINLANNVQKAATGREQEIATAQLMKSISELTPKAWNTKYDTYRYMNMLLSGKSRIKDFFLTGLNAADNAIDETIATGIDKLRTSITGGEKAFNGLHPTAWAKGLNKGFKEGIEDVSLGINTSRSGETGRYGLAKTPSFNHKPVLQQRWENITNNPVWNAANNLLATGEKALNYTIQVPDRMFYEARYASSLADQMTAAGMNTPTSEMIEQAAKEAAEGVYQDNSWASKLGNKAREGINDITNSFENTLGINEGTLPRVGNFIAPFVTTPANIVNQGLKNTFGAIPGSIKLATAKNLADVRDAEMLMAKNIKGLAPFGIGSAIGSGQINSNIGNNDYQADEITGIKPQSIVIGNKAVSFKDYPQWSIPMSIGAGFAKGGLSQALLNTGQAVSDISALKALGDLVGTTKSGFGQDMSTEQIADNLLRSQGVNILSQNIPFGGALGELRNDIDPYARELYTPDTTQYIKNRLTNRLPFASRTLPVKYNAVGEPVYANNIKNPIGRALSESFDFGVRNYNKNSTYDTYQQFKKDIEDTDIQGKTQIGFKKVPRTIKINNEKVKLNNQQYSAYQKDFGTLNYTIKHNLLNDPIFNSMSTEAQVKELNDWRKGVNQAVLYKLFGVIPNKPNKHLDEILEYSY